MLSDVYHSSDFALTEGVNSARVAACTTHHALEGPCCTPAVLMGRAAAAAASKGWQVYLYFSESGGGGGGVVERLEAPAGRRASA